MNTKVIWIGNKKKRELHRVVLGPVSRMPLPQPANCQLDEVPEEHRINFARAKDALQGTPKYDACAYCTKRFKSQR